MKNICAIILAAGKGTRLNQGRPSPVPKALLPLAGKPMVSFILDTLGKLSITSILVVGYQAELVKKELGSKYRYVLQKQRLGTGHAARLGVEAITSSDVILACPESKKGFSERPIGTCENDNSNVLILQADDSAFYQPETIETMIKKHQSQNATLSFLTTQVDNYLDLGRVIRDKNQEVLGIIEKENVSKEQAKIKEVNCAAYLVNLDWARRNLIKIKRHLKEGKEYPLPDIIKIALEQGKKVLGIKIDSAEWIGINTLEQYQRAEEEMRKRKISNF